MAIRGKNSVSSLKNSGTAVLIEARGRSPDPLEICRARKGPACARFFFTRGDEMSKEVLYHCDVCKEEGGDDLEKDKEIQVIFTTETTEGTIVDPWLYLCEIDICGDCLERVLDGEALFGSGAQGHYKYYFKEGGE